VRPILWPLIVVGLYVIQLELRRTRRRRSFSLRRRRSMGRGRRDFTAEERAAIFRAGEGRCVYCGVYVHYESDCEWVEGCPTCFQADHYVPWSRGGPTTLANGVTACRFHNQSKGGKTVEEFLAGGGRR
jgi:5-methylcytosine-specific restriction endonuclease McrA